MNETLDIKLHFQCAVPVLESEHCAPVEPEVGVQDFIVKYIGDLLVLQVFVCGEEQLHYLHCALVGDIELAVGVSVLASVYGSTAERVVGVSLVEPVVFVED